MTTWLEIVDTAVKVGLGALISGITTYLITRRTHSHETRRSLQAEKTALLKEAMANLDQAGSLLNEAFQMLFQLQQSASPDKEQQFWEHYHKIIHAYNKAKGARTLSFMVGATKVAKPLNDYLETVQQVREYVAVNRLNCDWTLVDKNGDKRAECATEVLDQLAAALESIYV